MLAGVVVEDVGVTRLGGVGGGLRLLADALDDGPAGVGVEVERGSKFVGDLLDGDRAATVLGDAGEQGADLGLPVTR
jgi:hypothetical protein